MVTGDAAREHVISKSPYQQYNSAKSWPHFPDLNGTSGETVRSGRFPSSWQTTIRHGLREPATGRYRVDVFREPHVGDPRMGRQSGGVNATVYVIVVGWATLPALSLALTMPNGNQPS
jgi:hypothetical protein